ncbi:MAG: extracellular solute-binding protein [Anaerolineae bacterium]|uniref:hypothetical protein n=1 Tax=Promineifilum sp. TaxID=2664178 RepID=UPI001DCDE4C7|nr:extracellular solute-binding protein [Anaerolineales bacterium]MCB8936324.1 extracellular solute-binding protein [Promineifilum sp.]MCO5180175.1 hypothetical protein [Promineifilum sp.]MCW5848299.1 extracellular solute-binding protein [Anaerolineae bacterium]
MKKVIFGLIMVIMLAACRGGGPGAQIRPTPISAPVAAEGGGSADQGGGVGQAISLRLWTQHSDLFDPAFQTLTDAYSAANPGVTFTVETFPVAEYSRLLQDSLSAGNAADIVQMAGGTLCVYSATLSAAPQAIVDLQPLDWFDPVIIGAFMCDGKLFGLPQEASIPWGLAVSGSGTATAVAWDFLRFASLDPANAAAWNAATGTQKALIR